jgi:hypothetical protein
VERRQDAEPGCGRQEARDDEFAGRNPRWWPAAEGERADRHRDGQREERHPGPVPAASNDQLAHRHLESALAGMRRGPDVLAEKGLSRRELRAARTHWPVPPLLAC